MKRKISVLLVLVMLFSALCGISAAAATPITTEQTYTHNFNVANGVFKNPSEITGSGNLTLQSATDSFLPPVGGGTEETSKGLMLKATKKTDAYETCTAVFTPLETAVIPIGTYEISIWVRHNTVNSSDWSSVWMGDNTAYSATKDKFLSQVGMVFYGIGATTETASFEDGKLVKFFSDEPGSFTMTNETRQSANKTWYKWTATVELTEPCGGIDFHVWKEGSGDEVKQWVTCVEDLSIKGTPKQQSTGITFRGVQESAVSGGTFNVRLVSTIDSLAYGAVGYEVSCTDGSTVKPLKAVDCQYVYDKVTGSSETGISYDYAAEYYNATYISALTITDLPADAEELIITVTPYTRDTSGTRDTANETTYTITYKSGVFHSIVKEA